MAGATVGIPNTYWHIFWTFFITVTFVFTWWVSIKPGLEAKFIRNLKNKSRQGKISKSATLPIKYVLNFSTVFVFAGTALFLIAYFDLWGNNFVTGGGLLAGSGILGFTIFQSKFGSSFLTGVEVLLMSPFDEDDWIQIVSVYGSRTPRICVEEVQTHKTLFHSINGETISIHNREILNAHYIINFSQAKIRWIHISLTTPDPEMIGVADGLISLMNKKSRAVALLNDGDSQAWYQEHMLDGRVLSAPQWNHVVMPDIDHYNEESFGIRVPVTNMYDEYTLRAIAYQHLTGSGDGTLSLPEPTQVKQPVAAPPIGGQRLPPPPPQYQVPIKMPTTQGPRIPTVPPPIHTQEPPNA